MNRTALTLTSLAVLGLGAASTAQRYNTETNRELGVAFRVHEKLQQVPMQLGQETVNIIQRFEPKDEADYMSGRHGTYAWQLYVLEFVDPKKAAGQEPTTGKPKTREEAEEEARRELYASRRAKTFKEYVEDKDPSRRDNREILVEGKERRGRGDRPTSHWWEYRDTDSVRVYGVPEPQDLVWYKVGCSYEIGDREITLLCVMPCKSGDRLKSKEYKMARTMVESLVTVEFDDEGDFDEERDQWAKSPEQKKELRRLKDNLRDLGDWDYFTTPRFIVAFSWDKPSKRLEAQKFAINTVQEIEGIREMFEERYPPHDEMKQTFSVIRVCSDYNEFLQYGDIPYGVVGWFSPGTKELCIFYDAVNQFGGEEGTLGTAFHEAWHQYADTYWPSVELHRWFDEGLAEYFSAHRKAGRGFKFVGQDGRFQSIRQQIREGTYIPSREIVSWHKDKFYGPRAPDHYAQGWAMVDFLIRGKERLGSRFPEDWGKIMEVYATTCLEKKSDKKAVDAAFEGIDFDAFDKAWIEWVESGRVNKG